MLVELVARLRRSVVALPLAVAGALLVIGISESAYYRASSTVVRLQQRDTTLATVQRLLRRLLDVETGQRGYLLTGRKEYLQPYTWAIDDVDKSLQALATYYRGDEVVGPIVQALTDRVHEKLSEAATTLQLFDEGRVDAWRDLMMSNIGKEKMDAIRESATALIDIESGRIAAERQRVLGTLQFGRIGVDLLAVFSLLALFLYLRKAALAEAAQRSHAAALKAERDGLEREVGRRTADLVELTRHLHTAREDERGRLARELHDELGALLTAAKLDVAQLRRRLDTPTPAVEQGIEHLSSMLNSGIALKRRIIEDLRPSSLTHLGLVAALEIQGREFASRCNVALDTELSPVALGDGAQMTVYRLVQEAFTNIAKHARASRVWLSLCAEGATVRVSVRDDGRGFDPAGVGRGSHGLTGMRYRVEAEGGRLRLQSSPGQGTRVDAWLPGGGEPRA